MWKRFAIKARIHSWVRQTAALLRRAQAEALGARHSHDLLPHKVNETSRFFPGNWNEPYSQHEQTLSIWQVGHWELRAAGQVNIGGRRQNNQAFFSLESQWNTVLLVLSEGQNVHWKVPQVAIEASIRSLTASFEGHLSCDERNLQKHHTAHPAGVCSAQRRLHLAVRSAHAALRQAYKERLVPTSLASMLWFHVCCERIWFVQMGDVHIYIWREGRLYPITSEAPFVTSYDRAYSPPTHTGATSFVGSAEGTEYSIQSVDLQVLDRLIICSKSICCACSNYTIEQVMIEHHRKLEDMCSRLADIAWNAHLHSTEDRAIVCIEVVASHYAHKQSRALQWKQHLEHALFER